MRNVKLIKIDILLVLLSLILLLLTHQFSRTSGFVHNIQADGSVLYCNELQSTGSDAHCALFGGYVLIIPMILNLFISKQLPFKILLVALSTIGTSFIFWTLTYADMADVQLTILRDKNLLLLGWITLLHLQLPLYLFNLQPALYHHSKNRSTCKE